MECIIRFVLDHVILVKMTCIKVLQKNLNQSSHPRWQAITKQNETGPGKTGKQKLCMLTIRRQRSMLLSASSLLSSLIWLPACTTHCRRQKFIVEHA